MKNHKKVLYITSAASCKGGIASVFKTIKDELGKNNIDYFFSYDLNSNIFSNLVKYFRFVRLVSNYDVIHLNTPLSKRSFIRDLPYVLISRIFNIQLVIQLHGGEEGFYESLIKRKIVSMIAVNTIFKSQRIVLLGNSFVQLLSNVVEDCSSKCCVVANPVDEKYLNQTPKELKNRQKEINVLYLSRIDHKKGCEIAIETINMISRKDSSDRKYILNICGDGPLLLDMKSMVNKLNMNNVNFHGYVSEDRKIDQFHLNDIFLFPTYYFEGLPISVLEGMAFGLPVITRPDGGLTDWIKNGVNGFLVDSKEPNEFVETVLKIINDPELFSVLSKNNITTANEHFSPHSVMSKYLKVYNEIS